MWSYCCFCWTPSPRSKKVSFVPRMQKNNNKGKLKVYFMYFLFCGMKLCIVKLFMQIFLHAKQILDIKNSYKSGHWPWPWRSLHTKNENIFDIRPLILLIFTEISTLSAARFLGECYNNVSVPVESHINKSSLCRRCLSSSTSSHSSHSFSSAMAHAVPSQCV